MTTILIIIISILGLSQNQIGGQKDSNGCLTGAGFQWSNLEKSCIRAFELKIQLHNSSKTFSAGILFSKDQSKAEIFTKEVSEILHKSKVDTYKNKYYILHKKNGKWILSNSQNKILYSQP